MVDSFLLSAGHASPLMEVFIFVYRQIGAQFGLDPSLLLTLLGVLWALSKVFAQIYAMIQDASLRYFSCGLSVSENDDIYHQVMNFLAQQRDVASDRFLMAQTVWRSAWEEEEEMANNMAIALVSEPDGSQGEPTYLNFANQVAQSSPRFVPDIGSTGFWHNGTYFRVSRKKDTMMFAGGFPMMKDIEEVRISCFGRDISPLKKLLADAKSIYYHDTNQKTTIYRPKTKEARREISFDNSLWNRVTRRPIRPMNTVVLDPKEKHDVLRDMNEYLHPRTPSWYASRGIPLRRGYLFHGPPGTGKTSFSFALAGVFGIDIYVISLQDNSVSEEDLATLFSKLPRRCVVLLEDIDTAGLRRAPDADTSKGSEDEKKKKDEEKSGAAEKKTKKKSKKAADEEEEKDDSSASESDSSSSEEETKRKKKSKKAKKRRSDATDKPTAKVVIEPISLSGLLNAIDGVASHEGRILIMTTNKPESLDEALIRPGRVDVQVGFKNASSDQAAELFHRMYEPEHGTKVIGNGSAASKASAEKESSGLDVTGAGLREISEKFGKLIPGEVFSPAEIQGFLLKRKKTPRKALEDAPEWIEASIRQKELKSKVATVQ
ncbi:BCS1 N terminal-domain-containing protein [Thelonectria olida]|uniref:BCS1 N terminal-domain-containing protein n=1 Tax=Thelonectria olida TaxID=1576542 RepID=A0A9P8W964_9HYPO|nr:BCS1 N terminal-domain-containing protein [Thelonectria olida]